MNFNRCYILVARTSAIYIKPQASSDQENNSRHDYRKVILVCRECKYAMPTVPGNINPFPERVGKCSALAKVNVGVTGRLSGVVAIATHCYEIVVVYCII